MYNFDTAKAANLQYFRRVFCSTIASYEFIETSIRFLCNQERNPRHKKGVVRQNRSTLTGIYRVESTKNKVSLQRTFFSSSPTPKRYGYRPYIHPQWSSKRGKSFFSSSPKRPSRGENRRRDAATFRSSKPAEKHVAAFFFLIIFFIETIAPNRSPRYLQIVYFYKQSAALGTLRIFSRPKLITRPRGETQNRSRGFFFGFCFFRLSVRNRDQFID